jgi:hypothetical protein
MSSTTIQIENQLFERLEPFFKAYEFMLLRHLYQFRKQTENGFQNVILSVSGSQPVLVEVNLGTRINMVEELAYQFTTGLDVFQENSNTLITSLGRIVNDPYKRFEANHEADVPAIADSIREFMLQQGFAFLEKYSRVKEMDALFNASPDDRLPYAYNHLNRCLRGIVLARIAGRRDFPALVATYRRTLERSSTAPPLLEKYDRLAHYLKTFSIN